MVNCRELGGSQRRKWMKDDNAPAAKAVEPPPPGFAALPFGPPDGFICMTGPFYAKREGDGFVFGFRVEPRHCYLAKTCHGGMLVTFADQSIPFAVNVVAKRLFLMTISLSADFLARTQLGAWVESRTQILQMTKSMVFSHCVVSSDGVPTVRVSSVMKLGPPLEPGQRTFDLKELTA